MNLILKQLIVASLLECIAKNSLAQDISIESKPYKIVLTGKQLNIKSSRTIQHIMLWTTESHRVVEQKNINDNSITIEVPFYRKAYYLMIILSNSKIYTAKIGVL